MPSAAQPPRAARVPSARDQAPAGFRVFIDFDNTISRGDILDGIIEAFSPTGEWRTLEEAWAAGRIGARECLDGQLRGLRARWPELARHLDGVRLDPGFVLLRDLLRREGIELTIVSDNFDMFLAHVLARNGLADVPCRANHLEFAGDRVVPSFPFSNPECPGCAHCKKTHFLPPNDDARLVVFIGDGRSDICPSTHAGLVFAKDSLLAHLRRAGRPCRAYSDLTEVTEALAIILHENKI